MSGQQPQLCRGAYKILKNRREQALQLPHPDEVWKGCEVGFDAAKHIVKFHKLGVIRNVEKERPSEPAKWRTDEVAWRAINEVLDEELPGPCNHTGVRNLGGGEYTCTNDGCEKTFNRDVAELRI